MTKSYEDLFSRMKKLGNRFTWISTGHSWVLAEADTLTKVYESRFDWEVEKLSEKLIDSEFQINRREYFEKKNYSAFRDDGIVF